LWPMYHEDIELSYRAWKSGYRIVYAPGSVTHHMGGATSKRVFTATQLRSFVRQNELLTVWKDVTDPLLILDHLVWMLPRLVMAVVHRDRGTLIGFSSAVKRLPRALRARRRPQAGFRRSDRQVLELVSTAAIIASATRAPAPS